MAMPSTEGLRRRTSTPKGAPPAAPPTKLYVPNRGRIAARLAASLVNAGMVLYIYCAHMAAIEWERFGHFGTVASEHSVGPWDFLRLWELEAAWDHLKLFSFSEAMLQNLEVYLVIGIPVSVAYWLLERDRVRWLQSLVRQYMPEEEGARAARWLELYLWMLSVTFTFVLLLAPFHLGLPKAHYFCAGCAFSFGCTSICLYLTAPVDFDALAAGASGGASPDDAFSQWATRVQRQVRPALKFVLWLHVAALVAGLWKVRNLGNDQMALVFGILETAVIMGYQLFQGIFVVDDAMVGQQTVWAAALAMKEPVDVSTPSTAAPSSPAASSPTSS